MIKLLAVCKYNTVYMYQFLMSPAVSLIPKIFPLSACRRKEPGSIRGFKTLTFGGSASVPPIRLQIENTWMRDSLKAWRAKKYAAKEKQRVISLT